MSGPIKAAFATWKASAESLAKNSAKIVGSLGDQAMCVSGQIKAALGMLGGIGGSLSVSVEVSVEVSGSASGSAG